MVAHIAKIRRIRNLEDCTIVLCLESNLAYECQHIIHAIQAAGVRKWVSLQEGASGTLGWLTTNERKEQMCLLLRESLSIGKLHFSTEFFSTTADVKTVKDQIEGELRNFCVLVEAAKTPFGKVKKTYSGKVGGRNDDLAISLQLALIGSRVFYSDNKYRTFRPINNSEVPIPT